MALREWAADEISRLLIRVWELETALKPFADSYNEIVSLQKANSDLPQDEGLDGWAKACLGVDLRRAAQTLEEGK
jgi:hypothetical protein